MPPATRGRAGGFTLLEVLVAVAVLAMVLLLLTQGLDFGMRATASQDRQEQRADISAVDAALRRLVADADPGAYPDPPAFKGTPGTLSLETELPGPTGQRQPADATVFVAGGKLRLRWLPAEHVRRFGPPPPAHEMTLLNGVRSVRFGYLAPTGWQTAWTGDALPALVRIELAFAEPGRHWPPILATPRREPPR